MGDPWSCWAAVVEAAVRKNLATTLLSDRTRWCCAALSNCCAWRQAGEGEDGRMKSAIGIGSLLMDGIGDTIRVSLTEDPELEMEPCR